MSSFARFRRVAVGIVAVLVTCAVAEIIPEPGSESVDDLFTSSTLVIKGEVKDVRLEARTAGSWHGIATTLTTYVAQVRIDALYKGGPASRAEIRYVRPEDRVCAVSRCPDLRVGEFDYFFLVGSEPAYEFRDLHFGKLRASRIKTSGRATGVAELKNDFVAGLQDADEDVRLMQVELIGGSGRTQDAEYLKRLLTSADDLTRGSVYYALFRLHDYSMLSQMQGFLEETPSTPAVQRLRFLCLSEISALNDVDVVDPLAKIAESPTDDLRESAIHALRNIGSTKTVPLLVRALDDRVQLVRYDAVLALASIEQNWQLAPAVDAFRANENKYISAWKLWWEAEGKQKYSLRAGSY